VQDHLLKLVNNSLRHARMLDLAKFLSSHALTFIAPHQITPPLLMAQEQALECRQSAR
jgi:hypothetical protein